MGRRDEMMKTRCSNIAFSQRSGPTSRSQKRPPPSLSYPLSEGRGHPDQLSKTTRRVAKNRSGTPEFTTLEALATSKIPFKNRVPKRGSFGPQILTFRSTPSRLIFRHQLFVSRGRCQNFHDRDRGSSIFCMIVMIMNFCRPKMTIFRDRGSRIFVKIDDRKVPKFRPPRWSIFGRIRDPILSNFRCQIF